jgi:hypothetical protein
VALSNGHISLGILPYNSVFVNACLTEGLESAVMRVRKNIYVILGRGVRYMAKRKQSGMTAEQTLKMILVIMLLLMIPLTYFAMKYFQAPVTEAAKGGNPGNGAPSGEHYNLNVHGKPSTFVYDGEPSGGNSLFIPLKGSTKISLQQGLEFMVLDADATDGRGSFQMPNPDPDGTGQTLYSVWVRPLAKPGGTLETTPCGDIPIYDPLTGEQIGTQYLCQTENVVTVRGKGKSKFTDVSSQLLYIYLDLDGDGVAEKYSLFDSLFEGTFWNMNNDGSRLVQFRFYPTSTSGGM